MNLVLPRILVWQLVLSICVAFLQLIRFINNECVNVIVIDYKTTAAVSMVNNLPHFLRLNKADVTLHVFKYPMEVLVSVEFVIFFHTMED